MSIPAIGGGQALGADWSSGWIVADDIGIWTAADHEAAAARAAQVLGAVSGVRAVVQFGACSLPGVSDLDLLLVVDDAAHADAVAAAVRWRAEDPGGAICTHQVFVLPDSLSPLREILFLPRMFTRERVLYGEPGAFAAVDAGDDAFALTSMIWRSTVWKALCGGGPGAKVGARRILLLVRTCAQSAARAWTAAGDLPRAARTLARSTSLRLRALSAHDRPSAARAALEEAAADLLDADWAMQAAWERRGAMSPVIGDLRIGARAVRFAPAAARVSADGADAVLPAYHLHLLARAAAVFPELRLAHGIADPLPAADEAWERTWAQELDALRAARAWGQRHAGDPLALFLRDAAGIFPTPFNAVA